MSRDEAELFARKHGMMFFETSAKLMQGVKEVFEELTEKVSEGVNTGVGEPMHNREYSIDERNDHTKGGGGAYA